LRLKQGQIQRITETRCPHGGNVSLQEIFSVTWPGGIRESTINDAREGVSLGRYHSAFSCAVLEAKRRRPEKKFANVFGKNPSFFLLIEKRVRRFN